MRNEQWAIRNAESSAAGANRPPQKIFQGRTPNTICYRKLLRSFILWIIPKSCGAEGVEGASGKPPPRLRRGETPAANKIHYSRKKTFRQTGDSPPAVTALLHRRRFHMHNHLRGDVLVQAHLNLHIADGADVLALDVALVHRNAVLRLQLLGNFRARN